jgi:hypothetical protein
VNDLLEDGDHSSELVRIQDYLGDRFVDAEVKSGLNLEHLDFSSNVINHSVQLVQVLFIDLHDVCLLFLGFYGGFEYGDLHCVVGF